MTAKEIKIALNIVNIAGPAGNQTFGVATPDEQRVMFGAVVDSLNKSGGVACRQLVPQYFETNPVNNADMQQKCLEMVQAGVFAVIDGGAYAIPGPGCFARNKMPFFIGYVFTAKASDESYPYAFGLGLQDRLYRNAIFALKDRGFFSAANGFAKLGFIYRSCNPDVINAMLGWMHEVGLTDTQIVTYDVGCNEAFANPSDLQQAVLKFQTNGVTHQTFAFFQGDLPNFTKIAQQQGFKPKWGFGDDTVIEVSKGASAPDPDNIANAIAITPFRNGEQQTPGMAPTPGTVKCDNIYRSHGMKRTWDVPGFAGNTCNLLWMFKAAVENAPTIAKDALAAGLQRTKSIDFSYPQGPNDFAGARTTTGNQFWRVAEFQTDCKCWRVVDREFHPSY